MQTQFLLSIDSIRGEWTFSKECRLHRGLGRHPYAPFRVKIAYAEISSQNYILRCFITTSNKYVHMLDSLKQSYRGYRGTHYPG